MVAILVIVLLYLNQFVAAERIELFSGEQLIKEPIRLFENKYVVTPFSFISKAWITNFSLEIISNYSNKDAFLCHTWLRIPKQARGGPLDNETIDSLLGISIKPYTIGFPSGFGIQINPNSELTFEVQLQNKDELEVQNKVEFKALIEYTTSEQKNVYYDTLYIQPDHVTGFGKDKNWVYSVSPYSIDERCSLLNQSEHSILQVQAAEIHTLKVHVHPYAEYVLLRHKNDLSTIWRGNATTAFLENGEAIITHADSIYDKKGIQLNSLKDIEICARYDNPTDKVLHAMAGVKIWYSA